MKLPKKMVRKRVFLYVVAFCCVFTILAGRVAWLQTVDGAKLKKAATPVAHSVRIVL